MEQKADNTIYQSISAAFLILIMHVLLLGSIGVLILFFYGIINHMVLIVIGISCVSLGGYWLYRRLKSSRQVLTNIAGESLKGKTVEISFLGGIANFKISDSQVRQGMIQDSSDGIKKLADPNTQNIENLSELARLYEKKLITLEEYNKVKQNYLK